MLVCGRAVKACHASLGSVRAAATAAVGGKKLSGKVAVVTASTEGLVDILKAVLHIDSIFFPTGGCNLC